MEHEHHHAHCSHHSIEKQTPAEVVEQCLKILKNAGFKMTKKREEILMYFAESDRYMSAQDIHRMMVEKYPTMSYNTTYRNIYDFVENGLLEGTEYNHEQMFRISCGEQSHHHHHFICTGCGITIPLDACPMEQVTTDLSKVKIESHRFEVFGKCEQCQM
ncbi:transcriptional repressor [Aerococcaceae bacterium zg-B36]|uniref:Fur family transcriptional regulator n=1 Tax=Aerococcaceae bacterium zg-252 TaxID=2796928 RepID=UPI001BD8AA51|nr:transcriptional repressor [Aerococcaceae bacterium zg-B36]